MKKVILLSAALLSSCSLRAANEPVNEVIEMSYEDVCDLKISWKSVFEQKENNYLVYFYSEECGYCNMIKQEVLDYCQKEINRMYFVDIIQDEDVVIKKPPATNVGVNSIDDLFILGTPSLIAIKEKTITDYYVGVGQIRGFISSVEDYNFSY